MTEDRALTVFSFFTLCNFSLFFFSAASWLSWPPLSFSNPTIPAVQLHSTFMAISTQPPSSCSFLQTAPQSGWPVSASRAIQGPFPRAASPQRWGGSAGAGTRHHPAGTEMGEVHRSCWAPRTTSKAAPSTDQQILQRRTGTFYSSCSWRSCSRRDTGETWSIRGFWHADCRVTKTSHLKFKANNTQETTARQSFCRRWSWAKVVWAFQHLLPNVINLILYDFANDSHILLHLCGALNFPAVTPFQNTYQALTLPQWLHINVFKSVKHTV